MSTLCLLMLIRYLILCIYLVQTTAASAIDTTEELGAQVIRLSVGINCTDREYVFAKKQYSDYWVLVNYMRAGHHNLRCSSSVTYTTHADYRYLSNVVPLVDRWRAPISIALYAPGKDFKRTVRSILWLRQCHTQSKLVRQWVSFHIYFHVKHVPQVVPEEETLMRRKLNCSKAPPPFSNMQREPLYRRINELTYPVNVGRNIAKEAALTHYVLASDIELYPTPGLVDGFLLMLCRNMHLLKSQKPIVYPLNIFEVQDNATLPSNKVELKYQLATGEAIPFHTHVCPECHNGPGFDEWINYYDTSNIIRVFRADNRTASWQPIYIGSTADPAYDERLSWEGMSDRRTQAFALCLLGYEFHTLDNAFLVHKPGIKKGHDDQQRLLLAAKTNRLIRYQFTNELIIKYGYRKGCAW